MSDYEILFRTFSSLKEMRTLAWISWAFLIRNTGYKLVIYNNKVTIRLYDHNVNSVQYKFDEVWDKLPDDFKTQASFHLDLFC